LANSLKTKRTAYNNYYLAFNLNDALRLRNMSVTLRRLQETATFFLPVSQPPLSTSPRLIPIFLPPEQI